MPLLLFEKNIHLELSTRFTIRLFVSTVHSCLFIVLSKERAEATYSQGLLHILRRDCVGPVRTCSCRVLISRACVSSEFDSNSD